MKEILIRASIFTLICIQVVSIVFLLDQGKTAKAEMQGCVPVGVAAVGVACHTSFELVGQVGGPNGCSTISVTCSNGIMVSAEVTRTSACGF